MNYEEKIKSRIETLKKERDKFIEDANRNIFGYNSAIAELEKLLEKEKEKTELVSEPVT